MAMLSLLILFIILLLPGGGYFTYAQAAACAVESALLLGAFLRKKELRLKRNGFFWGMVLLTGMYCLVPIWGIDKGLAWFGAIRAIGLLLFLLCLWQCEEPAGERILGSLPYVGSVMTVLSVILMLADLFPNYISVAGRLAGSFQYPNTLGIFLLLGYIEGTNRFFAKGGKRLDLLCSYLCMVGVVCTRSRGVYGLTVLTLIMGSVILWKKKVAGDKKQSLAAGLGLGAAVLVFVIMGWRRGMFAGIFSSSTLWGRLLYDLDAFKILGSHPLGLGYYGYYYLQGSYQTGVYAVAHVHNEYLQLALDIGILPAVAIVGLWIYQLLKSGGFRKGGDAGRKLMLAMLCLHLLVDYDMQFLSVGMIFVCLMDGLTGGGKTSAGDFSGPEQMAIRKLSIPARGLLCVLGCAIIIGAVWLGMADAFYNLGDDQTAIKLYPWYTPALEREIAETTDVSKAGRLAERILKRNAFDATAYEALAFSACEEGDFDHFIYYQKKAIEARPYDEAFRLHYLTLLDRMVQEYEKAGQLEEAALAYEYMAEVPKELSLLKKRTSKLGFRIKDVPPLTLPEEYRTMIKADKYLVYGE